MMNTVKISYYSEKKEKIENLLFLKEKEWCYFTADYKNEISVIIDRNSMGYRIEHVVLDSGYEAEREIILNLFCLEYDKHIKTLSENFENGFDIEDEVEDYADIIKVPYDPGSIQVVQAKYSLKEVYDMINGYEEDEEGMLDLSPDFQREYVWDNRRKSRLIESILLKISLPVFYLSRDKEGKMQVVDGMQRLTTINGFFKNKFKLSDLEYLENECGDCYFKKEDRKSLNPRFVRQIRGYQIDCNIIEPGTPENVKLDIFKRLNTGGKELNSQEIRHAFMKKNVRDFIKKLSSDKEFIDATDKSISKKRMMDQELILRFIGFYSIYFDNFLNIEYAGKMTEFLDEIAVRLNECKEIPYAEITNLFFNAMRNSRILFGKCAFRKIELENSGFISNPRKPINKALFIAFSICLAENKKEEMELIGDITKPFARYLKQNSILMKAISSNTNFVIKDITIEEVKKFLREVGL